MYELTQLGANTYFISASTNVGVWVRDGHANLIDSGLNDKDAENFLRVLTEQGWTLDAVYNTHYHADHLGGNRYLQEKTGCRCYCSQPYFAQIPIMNPSFMFGAYPTEPLRTDVFLAQQSDTQLLTPDVLPEGLSLQALHGHAYEQFAIRTPDDVLFVGDAVLGEKELRRYHLSYLYRLDQYLDSLDVLEQLQAGWFVPSHAEPVRDIRPLVQLNRDNCRELTDWILEFCTGDGMSQDELLKAIFDRVRRHMHLAQYALCSCTLHAYLGYLIDQGRIIARAKENILYFRTL